MTPTPTQDPFDKAPRETSYKTTPNMDGSQLPLYSKFQPFNASNHRGACATKTCSFRESSNLSFADSGGPELLGAFNRSSGSRHRQIAVVSIRSILLLSS